MVTIKLQHTFEGGFAGVLRRLLWKGHVVGLYSYGDIMLHNGRGIQTMLTKEVCLCKDRHI